MVAEVGPVSVTLLPFQPAPGMQVAKDSETAEAVFAAKPASTLLVAARAQGVDPKLFDAWIHKDYRLRARGR